MKRFSGTVPTSLVAVLLLAIAAHADTLSSTTGGSLTSGYGVNWFTPAELELGTPIDLGDTVSADSTGVLQASDTGLDSPLTPWSMTVTSADSPFFASIATEDIVMDDAGNYPVTFTFTAGNVNGFGIYLYSDSPLDWATLTAYNAADHLIGSITIDSPTQFVGILDDSNDISSVTLTASSNEFVFGTAYFTQTTTPEPDTFLLLLLPMAVFFFNRVKQVRSGGGSE